LSGWLQDDQERDVEWWLRRKFDSRIREVEVVYKEDLDLVSDAKIRASCR